MTQSTTYRPLITLTLVVALVLLLSKVHAQPMGWPPEFQTAVVSQYGFDDTVTMLKGAIEGENLMVIQEIDAQKMLRMVGARPKASSRSSFFIPGL